jgi:hypothetical protein
MKRVRYLAGTAGLAPAVLGAAMAKAPAAAHAAAAPATAPVKTVSLRHSGIRQPVIGLQSAAISSSTISPPASPSPNFPGCVGNTYLKLARTGNVRGHGWYANNALDSSTCIGTVDVYLRFNAGTASHLFCKDASLSIHTNRPNGHFVRTHKICGTKGTSPGTILLVHKEFSHLPVVSGVRVCAGSTYTKNACASVGS